jgi:hypothetical protein
MTIAAVRRIGETPTATALLLRLNNGRDTEQPTHPPAYRAQGLVEAHLVAGLVFDTRRRRPLVVTTVGHRRFAVDVDRLAAAADGADVVYIDDTETVRALCSALPEWLATYNGGTRVFLPDADIADHNRHTHIKADWGDPDRVLTKILSAVRAACRYRAPDTAAALAEERRRTEQLREELSKARSELADAKRREPENLVTQQVYSDPDEQFSHELWLTWLRHTPESDRADWPLDDYVLADGFLDSLRAHPADLQARALRACVDVVTGRANEIPARNTHRMSSTAQNDGPDLIREDGARGWRCAVATGTPAGWRLLWWEHTDGTVELAKIAHHDDYRM